VIDGVSLSVLGYGSGWAILALVVLMIVRGKLITPREADGMQRQLDAKDAALAVKDQTIASFKDSVETNNHLIRAVLEVAEERSP
jgi:hypothetical protein